MGYNDNIMSIQQASFKQTALFTKLYDSCEDLTLKHIKLILQKMFDHADDTLFALAEKTCSTTDSTAYFDSMRIIRLKRSEFEKQYFEYIKQDFADLKNHKNSSQQNISSITSISKDSLSLLEEADLEEIIAIKNIVSKVSHHCAEDLRATEKRLSHILNADVTAENNPLGPKVISNVFMKSAASLDIELKISLIILKLFDQEIVAGILPLLNEANSLFINANVLPEFKHSIKKSEHIDSPRSQTVRNESESDMQTEATQANSMQSSQMDYGSGQDTSIGHFHQLLNQQYAQVNGNAATSTMPANNVHRLYPSSTGVVGNNAVINTPSQEGGYIVAAPQFIDSLTQLQNIPQAFAQQDVNNVPNENGEQVQGTPSQLTNSLKEFVIEQLQQQDKNFSVNQIDPVDQDVIDIVSMLFDFILEDKNIPYSAKAHIARLQIPMLKAAILDKDFFSTNKNPARSLLNELAHAALGIVDKSDAASQGLLIEIERVVNVINDEFKDDLSLFEQQLDLFNEFLEQHTIQENNVSHKIEKKLKRKEDHALAYQWVEDTIDEILNDKHLPDVIIELINGPWKRVMLNTYLNNGRNSDTWKNQVRFIDVLEWSIQPKNVSVDRKKLANIIGQLVMTLRNGLKVIQVSEKEIKNILLQLEPFHLASINGLSVKDYLASIKDQEFFLFNPSEEKINTDVIPSVPQSNSISEDADDVTLSEKASSEDDEKTYKISELDTNITNEKEMEYEADKDYKTDLSIDDIDQAILTMKEELESLVALTDSFTTDNELSKDSSVPIQEAPSTDYETDYSQTIPSAGMVDDFSFVDDSELIEDDSEDDFNSIITEDIVLSGYSTKENILQEDEPQDEYIDIARNLEQGKWVEFIDDEKNKTRAKLARKSDLLDVYTFLNWKLDVVANKTLFGLAADLRRGSATIIDDVPLVDRALSAVMSTLSQQSQRQSL
ncbi:MAG: DUF1631 domain-containing protein [Methylococcales bacterium]